MKTIWHATAVAAAVLSVALLAGPVLAVEAPSGQGARGAIAVESLFGFSHQTTTTSGPFGSSASQSQDVFTLLGGGTGAYGMPRLGVDLFLPESSISLGASAYFGLVSPSSGTSTVLQFNPRVGLLVRAKSLAIWPRAGFDVVRNASSTSSGALNGSATVTLYSLTLAAPVLIAAMNQVAVVITPLLELGLGGSTEFKTGTMSLSSDQKVTQLGLTLGFLMFL